MGTAGIQDIESIFTNSLPLSVAARRGCVVRVSVSDLFSLFSARVHFSLREGWPGALN